MLLPLDNNVEQALLGAGSALQRGAFLLQAAADRLMRLMIEQRGCQTNPQADEAGTKS